MIYSILNSYEYEDKNLFTSCCDLLSQPLRVALGGKTIQYPSYKDHLEDRIQAIALCCLIIPMIVGAVCLLIKYFLQESIILIEPTEKTKPFSPQLPSSVLLLREQPFTEPYYPLLLTSGAENLPGISKEFVEDFLNHISEEFLGKKSSSIFTIFTNSNDNTLYVRKDNVIHPLKKVLEQIDWKNLEILNGPLSEEKTESYLEKSLLFSRLQNPLDTLDSPLNKKEAFLHLYTSHGFYSIVNTLIRTGTLHQGRLFYASQQINDDFARNSPEIISKLAKEVVFVSLVMAESLNNLGEKYLESGNVTRFAYLPQLILDTMVKGALITERGFLSTSAAGGGFAGGGPCDELSFRVRYIIKSKYGKHVNEFSALKENEVLFRPFTQFKIKNRSGDERSGFRIEMEEV